jgi:hypothetical protein
MYCQVGHYICLDGEWAVRTRAFELVLKTVFINWFLKAAVTNSWRRAVVTNCSGSEEQWL